MWLCETEEEADAAWFGVDEAEADAAYEALAEAEEWPVFRIPFGEGHTAVVPARNPADEEGTEYLVTHPSWSRLGHLPTLDGHQARPGLSWRELIHIARTPDRTAAGVHDPNARLLLLLPALGDNDLPADAADVLDAALLWAGMPGAETRRVTEALLIDPPYWNPAGWSLPFRSPFSGSIEESFTGILCSDRPGSPRYGTRIAQGITRDQSDRLAHALGTWPAD